jgi:hypothetical protein
MRYKSASCTLTRRNFENPKKHYLENPFGQLPAKYLPDIPVYNKVMDPPLNRIGGHYATTTV